MRFATFLAAAALHARYRQASLLLLEHSDNGFLIGVHKLRGVEIRRLALRGCGGPA